MPTEFPLCKAAGLVVCRGQLSLHGAMGDLRDWLHADDVEAMLAKAPVVGAYRHDTDMGVDRWAADEFTLGRRTHTARLVCIEPIQRDTAEGLLKELLEHFERPQAKPRELIERARRLLGEK